MIDHDDIEERIILFSLDALPGDERAAFSEEFDRHLAGCDRCPTLYADYLDVAGHLAVGVPAVAPPPDLEDRIMALVAGSAPEARAGRGSGRVRRALLSVAAAVVLIAGSVGGTWLALRPASGQLRSVALEFPGGGQVDFVYGRGVAGVVGHGVGVLPNGSVYQLWLGSGGSVVSAGTFRSDRGRVSAAADLAVDDFDLVAVSIEPAGGSPQPTSDPIASVTVS